MRVGEKCPFQQTIRRTKMCLENTFTAPHRGRTSPKGLTFGGCEQMRACKGLAVNPRREGLEEERVLIMEMCEEMGRNDHGHVVRQEGANATCVAVILGLTGYCSFRSMCPWILSVSDIGPFSAVCNSCTQPSVTIAGLKEHHTMPFSPITASYTVYPRNRPVPPPAVGGAQKRMVVGIVNYPVLSPHAGPLRRPTSLLGRLLVGAPHSCPRSPDLMRPLPAPQTLEHAGVTPPPVVCRKSGRFRWGRLSYFCRLPLLLDSPPRLHRDASVI